MVALNPTAVIMVKTSTLAAMGGGKTSLELHVQLLPEKCHYLTQSGGSLKDLIFSRHIAFI